MYNLQSAKEEIDQVAKHTSALTEYVMSLSERVQAHEDINAKLSDFKSTLMKDIEAKFAELERKIFGGEHELEGTSAVADLGHKIAGLAQGVASKRAPEEHHHEHHD